MSAPVYDMSLRYGARSAKLNENRLVGYCHQQKDSPGFIDFSDIQVVQKFAGMTH